MRTQWEHLQLEKVEFLTNKANGSTDAAPTHSSFHQELMDTYYVYAIKAKTGREAYRS